MLDSEFDLFAPPIFENNRHSSDLAQELFTFTRMNRGSGWTRRNEAVVVIDGVAQQHRAGNVYSGQDAYVVGARDKFLDEICSSLSATNVSFYDMRARDIVPLRKIVGMRRLQIEWNTKMEDYGPIGDLADLEVLSLSNTPKATDLGLISRLKKLRVLAFSGSVTGWGHNTANSLEPLVHLNELESLDLRGFRVRKGGILPLSDCKKLRRLAVSNTFPTEDFAYLAAKMPNTLCRWFRGAHSWSNSPIGVGADTWITGKRKPVLDSRVHNDRIRKYWYEFEQMKAKLA